MSPPPTQPPHQEGPWELVASSSSSELDEAEQETAYEQREGAPFAPLPLHHHQPPLLPWAHAPPTQTTAATRLRLESSSSRRPLPTSGAVDRSRGLRRQRLAKLLFWPPPVARWLPRYTRQQALGDLLGGVTVAVMVIPQGMSYGEQAFVWYVVQLLGHKLKCPYTNTHSCPCRVVAGVRAVCGHDRPRGVHAAGHVPDFVHRPRRAREPGAPESVRGEEER